MNKLLRTVSLMFALVAVPAIASASNAAPTASNTPAAQRAERTPAQRASMRMEKLDRNKDGKLSIREVKGTRLESRFAKLDTDNNKMLTKDELRAGARKHDSRIAQGEGKDKGKGETKGAHQGKGKHQGKGQRSQWRHGGKTMGKGGKGAKSPQAPKSRG